jgi:hypothetical protein
LAVSDESNINRPKTNTEIRQWYLDRVAIIPELNLEWIKQGLSARERAEAAWRIRHEARLEARSMMANPAEAGLLRARDMSKYGSPDGPTLEFLVERLREAGLEGDAVYEAIIDHSYKTDAELNKRLGF